IGFAAYRHLLDHFQAVTFESDHLPRIVSQKTELTHSEIEKDLRAEPVISQIAGVPESGICFHRVEPFFLQFVRVNFCREPNTTSFLAHIDQHAATFLLNLPKRCMQLISTVAPA